MAAPNVIDALTTLMEELRLLVRQELREVTNGLHRKLDHLEEQVQILLAAAVQPTSAVPEGDVAEAAGAVPEGDVAEAAVPPNRNRRQWTEIEIRDLIRHRVQHQRENPCRIWAGIAAAMNNTRKPSACADKWYDLVKDYRKQVATGDGINPASYLNEIHHFYHPVPGANNH
ncbi:hypothetical protein QN277_018160 [Acacia crassicarpa]|nr:hypothetical protein QN277_018160 [Acacia crassicarpa]